MSSERRPIEHLRRSVEILVRERDAAQNAFDSGQADVERLAGALETANEHLMLVERSHASRLAESHTRKDPGVEAALSDAKLALAEAQRSVWTAQADRGQAARALEILRSELAEARVRLSEEATRAKQAAAAELLEHAKVAWGTVRTVVDEVEAVRLIEHGQDPPEVQRITQGAHRFEREVLEGKPSRPEPVAAKGKGKAAAPARVSAPVRPTEARPVDPSLVGLRGAATVAGAAGLVVGSLLEWLRPFAASAVDLQVRALYRSNSFEDTHSGQISAGAVMIVLAVVALVGILPRVRLLSPLAGAFAAVGTIAYLAAVGGSAGVSFPSDVGVGAWLALAGGLVLVGAGFIPVRRKPAPAAAGGLADETPAGPAAPAEEGVPAAETAAASVTAPVPTPAEPAAPTPVAEQPSEQAGRRETAAWLVAGGAILLLIAAVAARNSESVESDVLFWTASIQLIWAVPVLVVLGVVLGAAFAHPRGVIVVLRAAGEERGRGQTVGAALVAILSLLLLVVAIQNMQDVEIDILFTTFRVALALVMLGSLAIGILVGAITAKRGSRVLGSASVAR